MAFILRRTATTHAHVHAAAARAVRTTSQRALASSSTDYSKPSKWGGGVGGRGGRGGSVWEGWLGLGGVARFGRGGSVWEGCLGKCLSVCVSACLALCVHELALCVHIRLHVMRGPCTRRLEIRAFRPSAAVKAQVSCHVPSTTHLCCVLHLIPSLYAYASDKVASFTLQPSWYSLPYITVHPPSQPPPSLPPSPPPPHQ